MILDGSDTRHVLGGNAQRLALLLIEDDAVEIDDTVLNGNPHPIPGHPGDLRQLGQNALADLGVARRGG